MKELDELLKVPEEELLIQLGFVSEALAASPGLLLADDRGSTESLERALRGENESARTHLMRAGTRILAKTSIRLHRDVCRGETSKLLEQLKEVLRTDRAAVGTMVVAWLVELGLHSTVVIFIAALITKALLDSAQEVICEEWGEFNERLGERG